MALDISRFIKRFVDEGRDHVSRLESGVAALEANPADSDSINEIFRSAHTIKGSSRMLKLTTITETAHALEDLLGAMREGSVVYTPDLGGLLQQGVDAIAGLVEAVDGGETLGDPDAALCAALRMAAGVDGGNAAPVSSVSPSASTAAPPAADSPAAPTPSATPAEAAPAASAPSGDTSPAPQASGLKTPDSVRIRLDKLDELISLMGEMISSHARLRQRMVEVGGLDRQGREMGEKGEADAATLSGHGEDLHRLFLALRDDVMDQELLMSGLNARALLLRMLPLTMVFDGSARMVRDLARSIGKEAQCVVSGGEIELDRQLIDRLGDPLVHILRNAVDHGIEPPDQREAAGKPRRGRISLSARQDGSSVVIEVSDDGGGLPKEKIRAKAMQRGLIDPNQADELTTPQVLDLIFLPGFSTSAIITDISGRGVGMDVVRKTVVEDLQGVINVHSEEGQGSTFTLRLPLTLAVMRVMICGAGGAMFGFTAPYVRDLIRLPRDKRMHVAGRPTMILRNEFIPMARLTELVGLGSGERAEPLGGDLVVVVQAQDEKLGLIVESLEDERDMVIKPLPEHMRKLALVNGMLITGKNELVSVLQVAALVEEARRARGEAVVRRAAMDAGSASGHGHAPADQHILVVDDSLNTREIEKDVLEAYGYRVTLAEDGIDGFNKAMRGQFDAVLTDVEMPGMDGFSLTAKLRGEEAYKGVPIVIITSREKDEDKRRGIQVGADAYIVKGDFEQSNLLDTLNSLLA